uniref:BACK domain-containing protein n=1 Tax=Panagrolaimus sp. JU765 TaxID=591449 RepID=A0AC34RJD0_9BILA
MAPKGENGEKPVIKIDDERISAANFRIFLKFLYTDQIEITGDNVFPLLNMAKMYDVPPLVKSCEEFLTKNLNVENAIIIANAAFLYENSAIFTKAIDYIVKSSAILKTEQKFCQMTSELLSEVLKQDRKKFAQDFLQIRRRDYCMNCQQPRESFTSSEISIFDMVLKWGKNKCKIQELEENPENLKNILETFLPLIRFSTMTADELISVV